MSLLPRTTVPCGWQATKEIHVYSRNSSPYRFRRNQQMAENMRYRAHVHTHTPGVTSDVFDGSNYRHLRNQHVKLDEKIYEHKYFGDNRDIALGLSTDGFAPFKRRKNTAWPLIIFNYNLPPEIRFHLENI
jgi:hypothetical protein